MNDNAKDGDIDILLLSEQKNPNLQIRSFRREFFKRFGWQKIDIVQYTYNDNNAFKDIALQNALKL